MQNPWCYCRSSELRLELSQSPPAERLKRASSECSQTIYTASTPFLPQKLEELVAIWILSQEPERQRCVCFKQLACRASKANSIARAVLLQTARCVRKILSECQRSPIW